MLNTKWSFLKVGLRSKSTSSTVWVPSYSWCDFTRKLPVVTRIRFPLADILVLVLSLVPRMLLTPCTSSPHPSCPSYSSILFRLLRLQISLSSFRTSQDATRMLPRLRLLARGRIVYVCISRLALRLLPKPTRLGDIILCAKFLHTKEGTLVAFQWIWRWG